MTRLPLLWLLLAGLAQAEPLRLLQKECFRCHTPEKRKGGLVMTSRAALLKGGDSGPAIVPGHPAKSPLVGLLTEDADPHMPPKGQLTPTEITSLRDWVKQGAVWNEAALAAAPTLPSVPLARTPASYRPVTVLQVSPDRSSLAVGRGADVDLFDLKAKELNRTGTLPMEEVVQSIAWSPDGKIIASGGFRRIFLWDAIARERIAILTEHLEGKVTALCFSGDTLVAADDLPGQRGSFRLWSTKDWSWKTEKPGVHGDTIYDLAVSPDGKRLASVSADKQLKIWNAASLDLIKAIEGHTGFVLTLAFSPNGQKLATGGDDEQVKVWSMENWKLLHNLAESRPTRAITDLAWLHDDGLVVVAEDGGAREWTKLVPHEGGQTSAGGTRREFPKHPRSLTQVAIAETRVFVGDDQGTLEVRDPNGKALQKLP